MPDVSPYGITQHATEERVIASALAGERTETVTANALSGASASGWSTAPYKPPLINGRRASRVGKCLGKSDTCDAPPMKGTDLCYFHTDTADLPER